MREYRFNLFGVGGVLILGRRGPRLKAIVDAVEIRTPDDSALARVRAADPSSDDDLVTRRHLQASTTPKLPLPATGQRLVASDGTAGEIRESSLIVDEQGNLTVPGNLSVQGDSVIFNTETVEVEDKNMVLAKNATTDTMADGGGITLKGTLDKIFVWLQARAAWFSSENIDLAAGKELRVDGTEYLAAHSTTNLPEGTNLYFTDQRARDANNDHRANGDIHISPAERTAWNDKADQASFNAHLTDADVHVTPEERTTWNSKAATEHNHDGDYAPIAHVDDTVAHVTAGERAAWNAKVDASAVGVADGVASLDASGKVPATQLPAAGGLEISTVYSGTPVLGATITPTFPAGKYLLLIKLTHSGSGGRTILYSGTVVAWSTSTYTGDTAAIYVEGSSASFTIGGSSTATISVVITAIKLGDL